MSNPRFDGTGDDSAGDSSVPEVEDCSDWGDGLTGKIYRNGNVYASIEDAVNNAAEDSFVELCPGTYRENIDLRSRMTLRRRPGVEGEVLLDVLPGRPRPGRRGLVRGHGRAGAVLLLRHHGR